VSETGEVIENRILSEYCSAVGTDIQAAEAHVRLDGLPGVGTPDPLPSRLATTELAVGAVAAVAVSAGMLAEARGAGEPAGWAVNARRVAASFRGDQLLWRDGVKFPSFAPLSGFFRTNDGWVRTHANYDHHRGRLTGALGLDASADRAALATRLEQLGSTEAEELIRANRGIAVAVRTPDEWRAHPQSAAVAELPLVAVERLGAADVRERGNSRVRGFGLTAPVDGLRPAAGLRVLDLTRVIAGPVATRTLALLGADVLRIDPPHMPEIAAQHLDSGMGKRSALLDLRDQKQRAIFERLLDAAEVVVTGYRPHALDAFGLDAATLAARRPGLVVATLDAWGPAGPLGGYRGFDSIVQAASGISVLEAAVGAAGVPGALPAQALDHATGYLLAAGVLQAVQQQAVQGGSWHVHAHLARTAHALIANSSADGSSQQAANTALDFDDCLAEQETDDGVLRYARPALTSVTRAVEYPNVGGTWGADEPAWA
jgi:crotonobetainyl-CoA:carnitine CoA-transferase CaiB-like acyl-CoA transferase